MNNTALSFSDKWTRNKELGLEITLDEQSEIFNWIINRNGFADAAVFKAFLSDKKRILDAGCGNGRVTALLRKFAPAHAEIVGIDLVAATVAEGNLAGADKVSFYSKNLMEDLSDLGTFDFIYCQEVLQHTDDPATCFRNLSRILAPGGEIAIYVYKKKAPTREFVDDYIREKISGLSYEEAMAHCREITALGKALHEQAVKIRVPEVQVLEIKKGEYDLQRFVYHFFAKCFWNDQLSFEDNTVINYDWYHPQNSSRHTLDEVRGWYGDSQLQVVHEFVDFYGITVRGRRQD